MRLMIILIDQWNKDKKKDTFKNDRLSLSIDFYSTRLIKKKDERQSRVMVHHYAIRSS